MYVFCVTLSVGHVSLPVLMLHVRLCCNKNNSDKRVNGHLNLFSTFRYAWVYFRSKQRKQYIKLYGEKNADTWVAKVFTDLVNYTIDFDTCHSSGNNARKSSHAFIFFRKSKPFFCISYPSQRMSHLWPSNKKIIISLWCRGNRVIRRDILLFYSKFCWRPDLFPGLAFPPWEGSQWRASSGAEIFAVRCSVCFDVTSN